MSYVIGIDLGTSAVKAIMVSRSGMVIAEASRVYPLYQEQPGYREQQPEDWYQGTMDAVSELVMKTGVQVDEVEGISFSGQMHGLVLLDEEHQVVRPAILWNDTRTTAECREIEECLQDRLLDIAKNRALEGFTLPKLLWVKKHEPDRFAAAKVFLLPKDYVRYRLTGKLGIDLSDAAGTLLLDIIHREWSREIADKMGIPLELCPPILESSAEAGLLLPEAAEQMGLHDQVRVFAGGADNACGAIGAGIIKPGTAMCSIGTSGVMLAYEERVEADYRGRIHYFNHSVPEAYYVMGVTLAAGHSMQWFRDAFASELSFDELLAGIERVPPGANGLLFTPYLAGERTPHADANIRGSFIGLDSKHTRIQAARAVMEGITFSLRESLDMLRDSGKVIQEIVSIGGGAKNEAWLQMQADIFGVDIVRLEREQGPAMGAAILAAYGCGWFSTIEEAVNCFVKAVDRWHSDADRHAVYNGLYEIYIDIYQATKELNERLAPYRNLKDYE